MHAFSKIAAAALLACSTVAGAEPLTVRSGESWAFAIVNGQPARAHRVKPSAKPAAGEIKVTMTSLMGTSVTLTNASRTGYTFKAELIGVPAGAKAPPPRTCTLPPKSAPVLEYWPVKATAVRLRDFRPAADGGNCP